MDSNFEQTQMLRGGSDYQVLIKLKSEQEGGGLGRVRSLCLETVLDAAATAD